MVESSATIVLPGGIRGAPPFDSAVAAGRGGRRFPAAVLTAALLPLLASSLVAWFPALHQRFVAAPVVCWSKVFLHRDCAGCGLTRSFVAFAAGDFRAAVLWNPFGSVFFLYLCVMALASGGEMALPRFGWRRVEASASVIMVGWMLVDVVVFYFV